jgi:hypothetical protein
MPGTQGGPDFCIPAGHRWLWPRLCHPRVVGDALPRPPQPGSGGHGAGPCAGASGKPPMRASLAPGSPGPGLPAGLPAGRLALGVSRCAPGSKLCQHLNLAGAACVASAGGWAAPVGHALCPAALRFAADDRAVCAAPQDLPLAQVLELEPLVDRQGGRRMRHCQHLLVSPLAGCGMQSRCRVGRPWRDLECKGGCGRCSAPWQTVCSLTQVSLATAMRIHPHQNQTIEGCRVLRCSGIINVEKLGTWAWATYTALLGVIVLVWLVKDRCARAHTANLPRFWPAVFLLLRLERLQICCLWQQ